MPIPDSLDGDSLQTMSSVLLRRAKTDDALEVLRWRNDPRSRAMSLSTRQITPDEHCAWFEQAVRDPARILLIGCLEDRRIGMVRFDSDKLVRWWRVSILLAPEARGQRLSKPLLSKAMSLILQSTPLAELRAEVKKSNQESRRLFESLGYELLDTFSDEDVLIFSYGQS